MNMFIRRSLILAGGALVLACGGGASTETAAPLHAEAAEAPVGKGFLGELSKDSQLACLLFTASCSSGAQLTGTFMDAPVSGLTYTATPSGLSGTTDALGGFKFKQGDSVAFSVLGVSMGSATPSVLSGGTAVVTPLTLTGESSANSPGALSITRLLNSLNAISVSRGAAVPGVMVIPTDPALATALDALATPARAMLSTSLQTVINSVYGAGVATVPSDGDSQTAVNQAVTAAGMVGTVWHADCPGCGGGVFSFGADGRLYGFTDDGGTVSGTWTSSSTSTSVYAIASTGGTATATIAAGATTGTMPLFKDDGTLKANLTISEVAAAGALGSSYSGLWFATFTPNAAGVQASLRAGSAYVVLAADGNVYGMTGDAHRLSGTWNTASGAGSASVVGDTGSITFNMGSASGTLGSGGTVLGSLTFARTGVVSIQASIDKAELLSLNVPLFVTWPSRRSFALDLSIADASGARIANTVVGEVNSFYLQNGGVSNMTDEMSLSYPKGAGKTYQVTFGNGATAQDGCTILSGSSGAVVDAFAFLPGAYATVNVKCN